VRTLPNLDRVCTNRYVGIVQAFREGSLSSATLLVNGKAVVEAGVLAQELKLPVGIHFNLTEGTPVAPLCDVSSLVGPTGLFHGKFGFFEQLQTGKINPAQVSNHITHAQDISMFDISNACLVDSH
jgi:predicted glycoside hydrolase/deacetylase ChbG (UPF0249 family)